MLEFYVLQSPITALLVLYSSTVQNNVKVKIIIIFKIKKKTPATLTASALQPCRCSTTSGTIIAVAQQRP